MAEETVVFARKASGRVREMSWFDVLLITIAGPAASGMTYYAVRIPGQYPGGNTVLAFFLGGLMWLLPVLLIAIYASSFPRSGAMYVVISRATHPFLGFLPNWLWIVSTGFSVGFLNYIMLNILSSCMQIAGEIANSKSLTDAGTWLAGNYTRLWIAMVITVVVWLMELQGIDRLKWFIRIIVYLPLIMTITALVILAVKDGPTAWNNVYGAGSYAKINLAAQQQGIADATMSLWGGIGGMLLAVFWAYTALESISFVGSEVKTPRTAFMRGMSIGFASVMALYMLNAWLPTVCFGTNFVRNYSYLYNTSDASKAALQAAMGGVTPPIPSIPFYAGIAGGVSWLCIALGLGFMLWFLNTSVIIWMASVRGLFAMAFDRQLPLSLCSVSKKGVPTTATHVIGVVSIIGCFIGLGNELGNAMSSNMLAILDWTGMFFIWCVGLAGIFLPYTRPDLFEKSTFQRKWAGIPVMTIMGVAVLMIGFYMILMVGLELATTWSQIAMAAVVTVGFILVAYMYNRNRKEGIDPNQIFAQIPPSWSLFRRQY
jgi:APA family basic amino acid/polyamine antiporter